MTGTKEVMARFVGGGPLDGVRRKVRFNSAWSEIRFCHRPADAGFQHVYSGLVDGDRLIEMQYQGIESLAAGT